MLASFWNYTRPGLVSRGTPAMSESCGGGDSEILVRITTGGSVVSSLAIPVAAITRQRDCILDRMIKDVSIEALATDANGHPVLEVPCKAGDTYAAELALRLINTGTLQGETLSPECDILKVYASLVDFWLLRITFPDLLACIQTSSAASMNTLALYKAQALWQQMQRGLRHLQGSLGAAFLEQGYAAFVLGKPKQSHSINDVLELPPVCAFHWKPVYEEFHRSMDYDGRLHAFDSEQARAPGICRGVTNMHLAYYSLYGSCLGQKIEQPWPAATLVVCSKGQVGPVAASTASSSAELLELLQAALPEASSVVPLSDGVAAALKGIAADAGFSLQGGRLQLKWNDSPWQQQQHSVHMQVLLLGWLGSAGSSRGARAAAAAAGRGGGVSRRVKRRRREGSDEECDDDGDEVEY